MNYFYDVMASFLILLVFGLIFLGLALAAMAKDIKKNWPKYKCNPMIMPVAGAFGVDPGKNFVECIGDIQSGFMGFFLGPIRKVLGFLGNIGGDILMGQPGYDSVAGQKPQLLSASVSFSSSVKIYEHQYKCHGHLYLYFVVFHHRLHALL